MGWNSFYENIKVNAILNLLRKILIPTIFLLFSNLLFCQNNNELKTEFPYQEINGNEFDGNLKMSLINNSNDTVFIILEPFECDITKGKDRNGVFYCASTRYSPNTISFIESGIRLFEGDCISRISYLKFPKILYLNPGNKTEIIFNIGELILQEIKNSNWQIFKDIKFALKRDVVYDLKRMPSYLFDEFDKSLFYKNTININLKLNTINTSVYSYNYLDSCNDWSMCRTPYDLIIIENFQNQIY